MATYTVGPGKDYVTIGNALTAAGVGDIVRVYHKADRSAYVENITVNNGETLTAADLSDPIPIDASGGLAGITLVGTAIVCGFIVDGATQYCFSSNSATSVVEDCDATNAGIHGFWDGTSGTYRRCRSYENTQHGFLGSSSTSTLENCIFWSNGLYGCDAVGGLVEHCVSYKNGSNGIIVGTGTVRNCISFEDTAIGIGALAGTYDNCCSYGAGGSNFQTAPDAESIEQDPLFINAVGLNFHLDDESPCVAAGSVAATPTTDFDGLAYGSPPSMGAFELTIPVPDPLIEIWHYYALDGLREIQIDEGGGYQTITLDESRPFSEVLEYFEDEANNHGALVNTYTFSYSESAGTITLAADANFDIKLMYSLYDAYGFSGVTQSGTDTYTSSTTVTAFWAPMAVQRDAPYPIEEVDLLEFRMGRAYSMAAYHGAVMKVVVLDDTATMREALASPLVGGRIRVHESNIRTQEYSTAWPAGYVDGYIVEVGDLELLGDEHQLAKVTVLLLVEVTP